MCVCAKAANQCDRIAALVRIQHVRRSCKHLTHVSLDLLKIKFITKHEIKKVFPRFCSSNLNLLLLQYIFLRFTIPSSIFTDYSLCAHSELFDHLAPPLIFALKLCDKLCGSIFVHFYTPTQVSHSTAVDSIGVRAQRSDYELFCLITNENIRPIQRTEITTEGTLTFWNLLRFPLIPFLYFSLLPYLPPASAPLEICREHFEFNCVCADGWSRVRCACASPFPKGSPISIQSKKNVCFSFAIFKTVVPTACVLDSCFANNHNHLHNSPKPGGHVFCSYHLHSIPTSLPIAHNVADCKIYILVGHLVSTDTTDDNCHIAARRMP